MFQKENYKPLPDEIEDETVAEKIVSGNFVGSSLIDKTVKLARRYGLKKNEKNFCDAYIFNCALDPVKAVEMAGYKITPQYEGEPDEEYKKRREKYFYAIAIRLLNKQNVCSYLSDVKGLLENFIVVDWLFIVKSLKEIAMTGVENNRIRALESLYKIIKDVQDKKTAKKQNENVTIATEQFFRRKLCNE